MEFSKLGALQSTESDWCTAGFRRVEAEARDNSLFSESLNALKACNESHTRHWLIDFSASLAILLLKQEGH